MSAVWEDSSIKDKQELLVMLALADWANDHGEAWPGVETLAEKARCSKSSAKRTVRKLEANGKLEVKIGSGPKGTNRYKIIPQGGGHAEPLGGHPEPGGGHSSEPGGGVIALNPEPSSTSRQGTNTAKAALKPEHSEFISLWLSEYEKHFEERYVFQGGKDGSAIKRLLVNSGQTAAELITIAKVAWKNIDKFNCNHAGSIAGFVARFNEIRRELDGTVKADHQTTGWNREKFYREQLGIETKVKANGTSI